MNSISRCKTIGKIGGRSIDYIRVGLDGFNGD
jgi:hypothetical protein